MAEFVLTLGDRGASREMIVGDQLVLRLPENPTTGYRWVAPATGEGVLALENDSLSSVESAKIGGGSERTLTFRAMRAGLASVELVLKSEFPRTVAISDRYAISVRVRE